MCQLSPTDAIHLYKTLIYIHVNEANEKPTIAFKLKGKNGYVFIDASCRVYSSWTDFKKNNQLPKCQVAYPRDGLFQVDGNEELMIDFEESPASSKLSKAVQVADTTSTVVGVATTAIGLVGLLFPVTAPLAIGSFIAGGVVGTYGAGRSLACLKDRSDHGQSVSLADAEARLHWLSLATAPLAIAGGGDLKRETLICVLDSVIGALDFCLIDF
jgi:hypothetical protein